jgi:hypothetical protein
MEKKPVDRSTMIRNILISAAVGIAVGLLLGALSEFAGLGTPAWLNGALIGAAIGGTYAALNKGKPG